MTDEIKEELKTIYKRIEAVLRKNTNLDDDDIELFIKDATASFEIGYSSDMVSISPSIWEKYKKIYGTNNAKLLFLYNDIELSVKQLQSELERMRHIIIWGE